ncbi:MULTISPECIES: DNA polymerase III subunit epsilon [unclassified Ectothiorhodospira]|uniref:DNA polymerase III subunit epsilon n=1 Tax=unclassified Ectothiorhodospira TaxID=2684909 RepID=UPI001EE964D7|nr:MULTISPECIES: DNA polymerase III subunit epsilon [unclassified Ectothiorhodospira]MCG5514848.1 DNA polymerase III subunit epsilon [Ectothiorhodospira sp. 9100]MCG5517598.1 DNA polymerase III subunit epsilon [Ectothiorhodospira sp. 9905]
MQNDTPARQIVLDTETTGLEPAQGHRIIEIGCVEMVKRRLTRQHYHQYLQPDREVDAGAEEVHGISNAFLADKPRFADVVEDFLDFIRGAELIIHNAPFDVGFINHELKLLGKDRGCVEDYCTVTDSLVMARKMHPGQRNSLDALCKRYQIDNSGRELHGALLDARILADVYLAMTGGQKTLLLGGESEEATSTGPVEAAIRRLSADRPRLAVPRASEQELEAHQRVLDKLGVEARW